MNILSLSSAKGEMQPNSPGENCYWMYDAGTIWLMVSGATKTVWYGQGSTAANRAATLAQAINDDANFPVYASYTSGSTTLNITSRQAGNYTCYSISGGTQSSLGFEPPSFAISLSGSELTGCR